ncbi:MAG TPA: FtsX-like permease family protein, partial [Dehalococcoidia bacterium]|nr:FtsX-like permease family protein [Dehalococcoidia bacterium]
MGGFLSVIPIVVRRVKANARLLLAVVIGAVLAAAIMSTTSIYTDAIRDLGLKYALNDRGQDAINFRLASTSQSSRPDVFEKNQVFIEEAADDYLGRILNGEPTSGGRSSTFFPTRPGGTVSEDQGRPRAHFNFMTGIEDQIDIVEGRLPDTVSSTTGAPDLEVAIGAETAERLGIALGTQYDLHPFWVDDIEPVHVTVVGIVEATDPDAEYWVNENDILSVKTTSWDTIPMLISEETFFGTVAVYLPNMVSDYTTLLYIDTSSINARNADGVSASIRRFTTAIGSNVVRTTVQSKLPEVLSTFDEKLFFTRIPLLVLVLQIAAIVLYYLFMVSTMLVERQGGEIALLKSRGATTAQVMKIYAIEGLAISGIAILAGPPLAATVISFLGRTPPFTDLTDGSNLQVTLSAGAYLWAGGGALLALVTLLVPAYLATRRTIVHQRAASARPTQQPFFMRYYLDLGLAAAGGVLLYQLDRRGGLVTEGFFGDQSVDPLMLLAPAFFILTVGIVFLRMFPLVLRVLAWVVSRAQGAAILIGMWQLVRNPVHYSRLVLLLMLATAVGMFAASFGATLETSYKDRAYFESGTQLRMTDVRLLPGPGPNGLAESTASLTGADQASAAFRLRASQGAITSRQTVEVIGVDSDNFADIAYFREDFAAETLADLMSPLREGRPETVGVTLPADARWLGIWVDPIDMPSEFSLQFEAVDATGRYFTYLLGPDLVEEMPRGWTLLVSDLERPGTSYGERRLFGRRTSSFERNNGPYPILEPQAPITVTSITLRSPTRFAAPNGAIVFDDLHTSSAAELDAGLMETKRLYDPGRSSAALPDATPVLDFDSVGDWVPVSGLLPNPLNDQTRTVFEGDYTGMELSWQPQEGQIFTHGLQFAGTLDVIPALASEGFLDSSGLAVGDVTTLFVSSLFHDIEIVGTYELFPTLGDSREDPTLVVDGPTIAAALNANPNGPLEYPDEIWLRGGDGLLDSVRALTGGTAVSAGISSFDELQEAQQKDPLVAAGWEGILFISFAAILILSAIGFLIYSYLTAQRRRLEFAVLRTLGFSRKQIALVVGFEQAFVIGLGMLAGTLLGMRLGSLMIGYMGVTETGSEVQPPMLLEVDWPTIAGAWLVLAAVFLGTIT